MTEHFTIAYYFERLADASAAICEALGPQGLDWTGSRRFDVRFVRELRAGASFHIISAPILAEAKHLQLGHQILDSASGEVTAWVVETLDKLASAPPAAVLPWPGPPIEQRPEPSGEGFIPTARDRVRPADLDGEGEFSPVGFVHRFTTGCLQTLAAIGADASYMEAERRGYSTFELALTVTASPRLGDPLLVESGIAHLGNSSLRLFHRMRDPRAGRELARMSQFGVLLDLDKRRPAPLPEPLRAAAARLLIPVA